MKKVVFFILLFSAQYLKSQDKYMSLSFGAGVPTGDLAASTEIFRNGYAYPGFLAEYSGAFFPKKHVGIGISLQFISSFTNQEKTQNDLISIIPDIVPSEAPFIADIGKWDIVTLVAGPEATFQTGKLHFDLYIKTGLYVVSPPAMKLSAKISESKSYFCSLNANYARIGFNSGINIRLDLNENTGLRLFGEYLRTNTKGEISQKFTASATESWNYNYSCNISILNFGIGLIYRL